jgi:hypothetical protein
LLFSEQARKAKSSINLGLVSGATIGLELGNPDAIDKESYINLMCFYSDFLWFVGMNYEIRTYNNKNNFYYLVSGGFNYGEMTMLIGNVGGPNTGEEDEISRILIPHIVFGAGYQTALGKDIHLFIEWDVGIKASISNINIGLSF